MRKNEKIPLDHRLSFLMQSLEIGAADTSYEHNWMFYSGEAKEEKIRSMYQCFQQLRARSPKDTATLLDCGSGDGMAAILANLAGFKQVFGIEISPGLYEIAAERINWLVRNGVIQTGGVEIACGSYYQESLFPGLIDQCATRVRAQFQIESVFNPCSLLEFTRVLLRMPNDFGDTVEEIIEAYILTPQQLIYDSLGLVRANQLKVDVVYVYPSDFFFDQVFLPNLVRVMKQESRLAVMTKVGESTPISSTMLTQEEPIVGSIIDDQTFLMQVYCKN